MYRLELHWNVGIQLIEFILQSISETWSVTWLLLKHIPYSHVRINVSASIPIFMREFSNGVGINWSCNLQYGFYILV